MKLMKTIRHYLLILLLIIPYLMCYISMDSIDMVNTLEVISVDHILKFTIIFKKCLPREPAQGGHVNGFK